MESVQTMPLHVTVAWASKDADTTVVCVTSGMWNTDEPFSGRPDTIPTTRFHIPASMMASILFSKYHQVHPTMLYNTSDRSTYAQVLVRPPSILLSDSLVQVVTSRYMHTRDDNQDSHSLEISWLNRRLSRMRYSSRRNL